MNGPTLQVRVPVRDRSLAANGASTWEGTPRFAFLELTLNHLDPRASAIAPNGARYVPVARELGRLLLDQQAEVALAVDQGATLELSDATSVYLDDVSGFDHVACHLCLHGTDPVQVRLDTYFYRGDRVVATTEQRGRIAARVAEVPAWLP